MNKCVFCGSDDSTEMYTSDLIEVVKCRKCNLVYQKGSKTKLSQDGNLSDYYSERKVKVEAPGPFRTKRDQRIVKNINHLSSQKGTLVDVGTGWGYFLDLCTKFRQRIGIEPNRDQAERTSERFIGKNVKIINGMYDSDSLKEGSVDVITFIQVLEHVDNPIKTLQIVYEHLDKNGLCVIDVPSVNNPRIILYRIFGVRSFVRQDFIAPHTFYYSYQTLKAIAEKCGFRLVKCDIGQYAIKLNLPFPLTIIDEISKLFRIGSLTFYLKKK